MNRTLRMFSFCHLSKPVIEPIKPWHTSANNDVLSIDKETKQMSR